MKSPRFISVTPQWSKARIQLYITQQTLRIEEAVISRLARVGETFVNNARDVNTYQDITGNLRNSIGYIILKDGQQVAQNFDGNVAKPKVGKGSKTGLQKAIQLAYTIAKENPRGFCLVCVAGMEYASRVEAMGKDVITGSSLLAKDQLEKAFRELKKKVK